MCINRAGCSVALLLEVGDHLCNELVGVFHVLELACGVLQVLLPEANDNSGCGLTGASTTSGSSELSDTSIIVSEGQHVLGVAHAASSLAGVSVAISDTHGASNLVDFDVLGAAVKCLERVLVGGEVTTLVTGDSPEGAIMSVDGGTTADLSDGPVVGVVIESVSYLIGVSLPRVLGHSLILDLDGEIFN